MEAKNKNEGTPILPSIKIYHPTADGKGSALTIRLLPATLSTAGYVQLELANQSEVADEAQKTFHRFDWKNRYIVKLNPFETSEVLQVLRREKKSIRDGEGIVRKSREEGNKIVKVKFGNNEGLKPGYSLKIGVSKEGAGFTVKSIELSNVEAMALEGALYNSLGRLFFG